ncbi:hypothetical protein CSTERLE_00695 [Thermoclostridium stercorarium subsp. leptospartum DSM 9219]|uniref:Glycosyltransferase 2-like domain-containing protein n=1 Tax=Thermoclostridium stercorarium subsp. leptospartum DSM 9219 TaxID=1346611 RepID=A0A1B1YHK9_THEST|nr:glycosyltransferase family 2 protein [Thermoclostridium stercorarium]ANX00212.1 hypothetical protein CSTERLE_00695 [Thermoclostridium stercorarium subsp. leptospartum DSM 9219]
MLISFIIPAFNVEKYIPVTLKSLLNQKEKHFEIIVIDDGSTDNTYSVAKTILKNSQHKMYKIIKKNNGGVSSARNLGIKESSGDYIIFLDGDDYVSDKLITVVYDHIYEQEADVILWKYNYVTENNKIIWKYPHKYDVSLIRMTGKEALYNIIVENSMWIWTGSVIYKKKLLIDNCIQFTEGCIFGEDQEFTYKALAKASKVNFINETLSYYVKRDNSISNRYSIDKFQVIQAMQRTYCYIKNIGENKNDNYFKIIAEKIKIDKTVNCNIKCNTYSGNHP